LVRTFVVLRALSVLFLPVYVAVWWSWYAEHPAGLAAAAATAAWGVMFVVVVSLRRGIGTALAVGNIVVAVGLAAAAGRFVPAETLCAPWMWVFPAAMHACVVAAWVFSARVFAAVLAAVAGATVAGGLAEPARLGISVTLLVVFAPAVRVVIDRLRRLAARADERLEVAALRRRAQAVAAARAADRRERERVLHDAVLNTLTGIGWGGGDDVDLARRQSSDAVVAVRALLDGRRHEPSLHIEERMAQAAEAARARGLGVSVTVEGCAADADAVPPDVVAAFGAATAELLANVERHAGTGRARVELRCERQAGAVTVIVSDDGLGFDPERVGAERLGLRHSVRARLADVGGRVSVTSVPERGTRVVLEWQAPPARPAVPHPPGALGGVLVRRHGARGHGARPTAKVTAAEVTTAGVTAAGAAGRGAGRRSGGVPGSASAAQLEDAYAAGMRRTAGVVAAAWQTITIVPLLLSLPRASSPALAVLGWLAASAAVASAVRVLRRRRLSGAECLALLGLGVAATVTAAVNTSAAVAADGAPLHLDWPALTLPMLAMLVAVSRPPAQWLLAAAATVAVLAATVLAGAGAGGEPLTVSQLTGIVYGQSVLLTLTTMVGPVLRRTAERTARALDEETELAALQDTEVFVRRDRARGLAAVERDVLPLLAAVGGGLLDPRDPAVRDRCARHAVAVRRTLAAGQAAALGELAPALVDAEQRGVNLDLQVCGDLRRASAEVRAELATHMEGALAAVPNEGTTLTLVCDDAGGSLFLTYPDADRPVRRSQSRPLPRAAEPPRPRVEVNTDHGDGRVCVELHWDDAPHPA
jgi:signal transduction histidine kinase